MRRDRTRLVAATLRGLAPDPARASQALDRALPLELAGYRPKTSDSVPTPQPKRGDDEL
jgi:hypothetical protein